MGALAEATIPRDKRWIPKGMEVAYTAKADSDITCIAETDPEQWTDDDPDLPRPGARRTRRRHRRDRGRHPAVGDAEAAALSVRGRGAGVAPSPTIDTSSTFFSPTNFRCTHMASQVSSRLTTTYIAAITMIVGTWFGNCW